MNVTVTVQADAGNENYNVYFLILSPSFNRQDLLREVFDGTITVMHEEQEVRFLPCPTDWSGKRFPKGWKCAALFNGLVLSGTISRSSNEDFNEWTVMEGLSKMKKELLALEERAVENLDAVFVQL